MKTNGEKREESNTLCVSGTDWGKLRRMSAASIREGIAADPDANATNKHFWKSATVVMPTRMKE